MGRFRRWGVPEDAAFLGQDWHFTVDLQIRGCGKWQDAANHTTGHHFTVDLQIKGCSKSKDAANHTIGRHFTVDLQIKGFGKSKDLANQTIGVISWSIYKSEYTAFQRIRRFAIDWHFTVCKSEDAANYRMGPFPGLHELPVFAHVLHFFIFLVSGFQV